MKHYTREHREKYGKRIAMIVDGLYASDHTRDPKVLSERLKIRLSKYKEDCKFQPEEINLRDYIGKKDSLYKKLEEYPTVFVNGGNLYNIRDLANVSGLKEWLIDHIEDPDRLMVGACAGSALLAKDYSGVEIYDNPKADWFGLGELRDYSQTGWGVTEDLICSHWKDKPHAEGGYGGDLVEKIYNHRVSLGIPTTLVSDHTMYVRDLKTGKEEIVSYVGPGKIDIKTDLVNGEDVLRNWEPMKKQQGPVKNAMFAAIPAISM